MNATQGRRTEGYVGLTTMCFSFSENTSRSGESVSESSSTLRRRALESGNFLRILSAFFRKAGERKENINKNGREIYFNFMLIAHAVTNSLSAVI